MLRPRVLVCSPRRVAYVEGRTLHSDGSQHRRPSSGALAPKGDVARRFQATGGDFARIGRESRHAPRIGDASLHRHGRVEPDTERHRLLHNLSKAAQQIPAASAAPPPETPPAFLRPVRHSPAPPRQEHVEEGAGSEPPMRVLDFMDWQGLGGNDACRYVGKKHPQLDEVDPLPWWVRSDAALADGGVAAALREPAPWTKSASAAVRAAGDAGAAPLEAAVDGALNAEATAALLAGATPKPTIPYPAYKFERVPYFREGPEKPEGSVVGARKESFSFAAVRGKQNAATVAGANRALNSALRDPQASRYTLDAIVEKMEADRAKNERAAAAVAAAAAMPAKPAAAAPAAPAAGSAANAAGFVAAPPALVRQQQQRLQQQQRQQQALPQPLDERADLLTKQKKKHGAGSRTRRWKRMQAAEANAGGKPENAQQLQVQLSKEERPKLQALESQASEPAPMQKKLQATEASAREKPESAQPLQMQLPKEERELTAKPQALEPAPRERQQLQAAETNAALKPDNLRPLQMQPTSEREPKLQASEPAPRERRQEHVARTERAAVRAAERPGTLQTARPMNFSGDWSLPPRNKAQASESAKALKAAKAASPFRSPNAPPPEQPQVSQKFLSEMRKALQGIGLAENDGALFGLDAVLPAAPLPKPQRQQQKQQAASLASPRLSTAANPTHAAPQPTAAQAGGAAAAVARPAQHAASQQQQQQQQQQQPMQQRTPWWKPILDNRARTTTNGIQHSNREIAKAVADASFEAKGRTASAEALRLETAEAIASTVIVDFSTQHASKAVPAEQAADNTAQADGKQQQNGQQQQQQEQQRRRQPYWRQQQALQQQNSLIARPVLPENGLTVRELSQLVSRKVDLVLRRLRRLGARTATEETFLDQDTAELVCEDLRVAVQRAAAAQWDVFRTPIPHGDVYATLPVRPPVVSVMGHVDHGKTTLLDALRRANTAAGEDAGITQRVSAFSVKLDGQSAPVTFFDTPGHAAFAAMRKGGAALTDVVVVVIAAEDGLRPQTREVLRLLEEHPQLQAVIAVTKIDRCVDADAAAAARAAISDELERAGLLTEDKGGDVPIVAVSGVTGEGLAELVETVSLQAEMMELHADMEAPGEGVVMDSAVEKGSGFVADVLVTWGSLKEGAHVVVGQQYGRVRRMVGAAGDPDQTATATAGRKPNKSSGAKDQTPSKNGSSSSSETAGTLVKSARVGEAVRICGLKGLPTAGDELLTVESEEKARAVAERRQQLSGRRQAAAEAAAAWDRAQEAEKEAKFNQKEAEAAGTSTRRMSLVTAAKDSAAAAAAAIEELEQQESGESVAQRTLSAVFKAENHGVLAAMHEVLKDVPTEAVALHVLHGGVGPVSRQDVERAAAAEADIWTFNVGVTAPDVRALARSAGVEIRPHKVIYRFLEEMRERLGANAKAEAAVKSLGRAEVVEVFSGGKKTAVAGCRVTDGKLLQGKRIRVLRSPQPGSLSSSSEPEVVFDAPKAASMRHMKDKVSEALKGQECGVTLDGFSDFKAGDVLESYELEDGRSSG